MKPHVGIGAMQIFGEIDSLFPFLFYLFVIRLILLMLEVV